MGWQRPALSLYMLVGALAAWLVAARLRKRCPLLLTQIGTLREPFDDLVPTHIEQIDLFSINLIEQSHPPAQATAPDGARRILEPIGLQ